MCTPHGMCTHLQPDFFRACGALSFFFRLRRALFVTFMSCIPIFFAPAARHSQLMISPLMTDDRSTVQWYPPMGGYHTWYPLAPHLVPTWSPLGTRLWAGTTQNFRLSVVPIWKRVPSQKYPPMGGDPSGYLVPITHFAVAGRIPASANGTRPWAGTQHP